MAKCYIFCITALMIFSGCNFNAVVDTNTSVRDGAWLYADPALASFEIKDANAAYDVNFKLRINSAYRYSNIYVIMSTSNGKVKKKVRHGLKIANEEGAWLGKGSGNIYTYAFPMMRKYRFADTGKYTIAIEQNMRDNPLIGISDVGIEVLKR